MSHFLDIIIPEYNCKEEYLDRLLKSILNQKNIDLKEIGIIIVNDNSSKKFKNGFFRKYPQLNIEYYIKDINEGVGMTRQFGLNKSNAKYITFIDQDDELYNDSLSIIINYLKNNDNDLLLTEYVEEVLVDNNIQYRKYSAFDTKESLHGVFIKRIRMVENDIHFVSGVRYHDDFYIRRILTTLLPVSTLNVLSYLWKYNDTSVVRRERSTSYQAETFEDIFLAVKKRIEFFDSREIYVNELSVCSILLLIMIIQYDLSFDKSLHDKYEKELFKLICDNNDKFESVKDKLDLFYDNAYSDFKNSRPNVGLKQDFKEYLNYLKNKYPEYKYEIIEFKSKLGIIINYNNLISRTLDSIFCQIGINRKEIEIIIVGNKNEIQLSRNYLNGEYKEYSKISVKIVDNIKSFSDFDFKYLTFINSGDILYKDNVLRIILSNINDKIDVLSFKSLSYNSLSNSLNEYKHDIYGNIYNMKLLINNDIKYLEIFNSNKLINDYNKKYVDEYMYVFYDLK